MSPIPPDATWQEWNDLCFRAARVMGISLEAIGEKRVTDVLQALHAHREEPVIVLDPGLDGELPPLDDVFTALRDLRTGASDVDSGDREVVYIVTLFTPTANSWPEEVDLDGIVAENGNVDFISKATRLHDDLYKALARVGNNLCIVKVRVKLRICT